jgi:hypothetical protein
VTWNYRLVRFNEEDVEIAEVYYSDDGVPTDYAVGSTGGTCVEEIEQALKLQISALYKSVLATEPTDEGGVKLVDTRELLTFRATAEPPDDTLTH